MLHQIGASECPRCTTQLVHEFELASEWVLPSQQEGMDQRWICPGCGYSRPVTYMVDRPIVTPSFESPQASRQRGTVQ